MNENPKPSVASLKPNDHRRVGILTNSIAWAIYGPEDESGETQFQLEADKVDKCRQAAIRCVNDLNEDSRDRQEQSNLVQHARRELEILGEDEEVIDWMCETVLAFASFGHSGGSASICVPMLNDLLQYKNLTALTDDPDEWFRHEENLWQNVRNSAAFSTDEGKTYTLIDDPEKVVIKTYSKDEDEPRVLHGAKPFEIGVLPENVIKVESNDERS